jgi:hypothetical protein
MFIELGIITITYFVNYFIQLEPYTIIKNYITIKYNKLKRLTNLVSTRYDSSLLIVWISFIMLCKAFYQQLLQYLNNSVKKIDKNTYEVSYIINGKSYKMVVKPVRGPIPILCVVNENCIDVTDEIIQYLGPKNDWSGFNFYPDFFKYKKLEIQLSNGDVKVFNHSETIIL